MQPKKNYLTIELDANDIQALTEVKKVNIGDIMTQNNFSIVTNSNEEKLNMIVREILSEEASILIGFACYNLSDLIYINNRLKYFNTAINTVFIPSPKRIEQRISEAKENARLHGRWLGSSEEEVENNFINFKSTLQEIKNELRSTALSVVEY